MESGQVLPSHRPPSPPPFWFPRFSFFASTATFLGPGIQCWASSPLLTLGCLHLRLSFSSCLKRSRPLGWLTSRRSWDARYVRNLTMIIFQNLSIPVTCTPYIAVLLMSLVVYRSARSCSTSPSHSLTVCTRFVVPA